MVSMLISPTDDVGWTIAVDDFRTWLVGRWPDLDEMPSAGDQRAHRWQWPDKREVWIPADREVAWTDADPERTAAISAHLASAGPANLVLADESYEFVLELSDLNETQILERLRDEG